MTDLAKISPDSEPGTSARTRKLFTRRRGALRKINAHTVLEAFNVRERGPSPSPLLDGPSRIMRTARI
jgi:hypothetical protein